MTAFYSLFTAYCLLLTTYYVIMTRWITNEDILCVLDDIYTFDVIEEEQHHKDHALNKVPLHQISREHHQHIFCLPPFFPIASLGVLAAGLAAAVALRDRASLVAWQPSSLVLGSSLSAALMSLTAGHTTYYSLLTAHCLLLTTH